MTSQGCWYHNLHHLDLAIGQDVATQDAVDSISKGLMVLSELTSFSLKIFSRLSNDQFGTLLTPLRLGMCKKLDMLSLQSLLSQGGPPMIGDVVGEVLQSGHLPRLQELDLGRHMISDQSGAIGRAVESGACREMVLLHSNWFTYTDNQMAVSMERGMCRQVWYLEIVVPHADAMPALARAIAGGACPELHQLHLHNLQSLTTPMEALRVQPMFVSSIQEVMLAGSMRQDLVPPGVCEVLLMGLYTSPCSDGLRLLHFDHLTISPECVVHVMAPLLMLPGLEEWHVSHSEFEEGVFESLAHCIVISGQQLPLKTLRIIWCNFGNLEMISLIRLLPHLPNLTHITISGVNTDDKRMSEFIKALAQGHQAKLTEMDLEMSGMGYVSVVGLLHAINDGAWPNLDTCEIFTNDFPHGRRVYQRLQSHGIESHNYDADEDSVSDSETPWELESCWALESDSDSEEE
jgi:hypothetical protein